MNVQVQAGPVTIPAAQLAAFVLFHVTVERRPHQLLVLADIVAGIRAPGLSGPIGDDKRIYDHYSTINGFSKIY